MIFSFFHILILACFSAADCPNSKEKTGTVNEINIAVSSLAKFVNDHWNWIVPVIGVAITLASWRVVKYQIRCLFGG